MFKKLLFHLFFFCIIFNPTTIVNAYNFETHSGAEISGYAAGYDEANLTDDSFEIVVGKIVKIILSFLGVFFLLLMIYAGFIWMFSRGNSSDVEKAKKIMQNAIWGIIVVLLAYAVTYFIMSTFTN